MLLMWYTLITFGGQWWTCVSQFRVAPTPSTSRRANGRNWKPGGGGGRGKGREIGSQCGGDCRLRVLLPYIHTDKRFSLSHLLSELWRVLQNKNSFSTVIFWDKNIWNSDIFPQYVSMFLCSVLTLAVSVALSRAAAGPPAPCCIGQQFSANIDETGGQVEGGGGKFMDVSRHIQSFIKMRIAWPMKGDKQYIGTYFSVHNNS